MEGDTSSHSDEPRRDLGGFAAFSVVTASMIGIGIFLMPRIVAESVPSTAGFLGLWALGGLVALAGAVACGELGAMIPRAGGDYVFQHRAFGPSTAFASGWVLFGAVFTGSIAATAVAVLRYQASALLGYDLMQNMGPIPMPWAHGLACILIVALTALNAAGVRLSASTQAWITYPPIVVFLILAVATLATTAPAAPTPPPATEWTARGFTTAFVSIYFAYSGWINVIYVAGEVRDPGRNVPRALIGGTLAVTALYLVLCWTFLHALGLGGIAGLGYQDAGSATAASLGGPTATTVITAAIALALVATTNATILGGARVAYAMAQKGALSAWFGHTVAGSGVPARALWFQAAISILLVLTNGFDTIVEAVGLAMLVTGSLTIAALFALRRSDPGHDRPYRAFGYPVLPGLYLVACLFVLAESSRESATRLAAGEAEAALPLLGLGIAVVTFVAHRFGPLGRSS